MEIDQLMTAVIGIVKNGGNNLHSGRTNEMMKSVHCSNKALIRWAGLSNNWLLSLPSVAATCAPRRAGAKAGR